jgi:hypothetical protein
MGLPKLVVGERYRFEQPGFPMVFGVVVLIRPADEEPIHVWIDRPGEGGAVDPDTNPSLLVLGSGWVVTPQPTLP